MRYAVAGLVAALAGLTNAWTEPKGPEPIGNPFKTPELATQVPKGKAYKVTWEPTIDKAGTVTILLLRGPSENAVPQYAIAEKIPNSGSFTWTPSSDLETDKTHYGLQLVVDATGQYQYTPQFGISGKASSGGGEDNGSGYPTASRPAEPPKATSVPSYSMSEPSGNVPPAPSATKTGPVYVTSTYETTICTTTGTAPGVPAPSGSGAPVPPPAAPPAGTAPVGTGAPGVPPAPPAQTSEIATGAAGKTMVASGAAVMAALIAFAL